MPVPAVGVPSHNGNSVASVRGVDTASWNNKRLCFVAFTFLVRKHLVERQTDDSSNIFPNNPSGLDFFNNSKH